VITLATLRARTVKDLAAMAKRKSIPGWHGMRKDELARALVNEARREAAKAAKKGNSRDGKGPGKAASAGTNGNGKGSSVPPRPQAACRAKPKPARSQKRLSKIRAKLAQSKDLAHGCESNGNGHVKDRLVVMVRDPYWLHAYWELTRQSVERARVAMGQQWHAAKPVLRVYEVGREGATSTVRKVVRDVEIHGGVNNWYVDVDDPPKSFQIDIGYVSPDGKFLCIVRSNVVTTPQSGPVDSFDGNWEEVAEDFDRIYALSGGYGNKPGNADLKNLFEERLRRPMGSPMVTRFGMGAQSGRTRPSFSFQVDAELIVYGMTDPSAHVTLKGEPVRVQPDGSFTVRFTLPNRRQVLPVVASSVDGVEQRTIVLAVERNTKEMEPVIREPDA